MAICQAEISQGRAVRPEPVGDDGVGQVTLPLQQFPKELDRCLLVAARLQEDVEHLAFVIDCPPEVMDLAADPEENLVEMPPFRRTRTPLPDPRSKDPAEFQRLLANRLVGHVDATLCEQIFNISIAEREPEVEPNRMLDNRGREAVAGVGEAAHAAPYPIDAAEAIQLT